MTRSFRVRFDPAHYNRRTLIPACWRAEASTGHYYDALAADFAGLPATDARAKFIQDARKHFRACQTKDLPR